MKIAQLSTGHPEIFHTLQGEGLSAGVPAVFVRASQCNLHCIWCDTDYTWNWTGTPWPHEKDSDTDYEKFNRERFQIEMTPADVAGAIREHDCRRLVVTGGEPLVQQEEFIDVLEILRSWDPAWTFELETNGTIHPHEDLDDLVDQYNVSPKLKNSGNPTDLRLVESALSFFAASSKAWFKFVVAAPSDLAEVTALQDQLGLASDRIILMPEGRDSATLQTRRQWLADRCIGRGYRYSDRLHIQLWGNEPGR